MKTSSHSPDPPFGARLWLLLRPGGRRSGNACTGLAHQRKWRRCQGVRSNQLTGYSLVVGPWTARATKPPDALHHPGHVNYLQQMGISLPPSGAGRNCSSRTWRR